MLNVDAIPIGPFCVFLARDFERRYFLYPNTTKIRSPQTIQTLVLPIIQHMYTLTSPSSVANKKTMMSSSSAVLDTVYAIEPSGPSSSWVYTKHPSIEGAAFASIVNDPSPEQVLRIEVGPPIKSVLEDTIVVMGDASMV